MADKKISALTAASTPLAGTEVLPIVQSGATVKATVADVTGAGAYPGHFTTVRSYRSGVDQSVQVSVSGGESFIAAVNDTNSNEMPLYLQVQNTGLALTSVASVTSAGVRIITGNLIQGTAATGVNFTANTPAAGMTSQLLNWYEEGTFTPTVTATTGSLSSVSATGTYTRIGRQVYVAYNVLISSNGTGATSIRVAGLPFTIANNRPYGVGNETDAVGFNIISQGIVGTNYANVVKFDGTYPGGSGYRLQGDFTYTV